jgi:hypothetical protein
MKKLRERLSKRQALRRSEKLAKRKKIRETPKVVEK